MSEQAQLFLLQRRLNEIKSSKRNVRILMIVFCVVLALVWPYDFVSGLITAMVVGIVVVFSVDRHYRGEEFKILGLIQQMTFQIPRCPYCGKEVLQGNFEFCPFCGKSLKP